MTSPQRLLLDEADRSITAAEVLIKSGYPGYAASRLYYAMFHSAEALLTSAGLAFSSHGAVISAFGREFAKPGKVPMHLHRWLIDAQAIRETGDYHDSTQVTTEEANDMVVRAREFLDTVRTMLT